MFFIHIFGLFPWFLSVSGNRGFAAENTITVLAHTRSFGRLTRLFFGAFFFFIFSFASTALMQIPFCSSSISCLAQSLRTRQNFVSVLRNEHWFADSMPAGERFGHHISFPFIFGRQLGLSFFCVAQKGANINFDRITGTKRKPSKNSWLCCSWTKKKNTL